VCKVEVSEDGSGDLQATGEANRLNEDDFVETPANGEIAANPLPQIDKPADDRERSRFRSWLLAGVVILFVGLATAIWYLRRPLPVPRITDYAQITRDGQRKILGGTDGARLYFTHWNTSSIGQVPIAGGQIAKIPVALQGPWLKDVSPDGSRLLIASRDGGLWSIGVLGDPMHHVANGVEGAWSPDGRSTVYTDSTGDIYVVQSDGSNPYRLNASTGPSPDRLTFDLSWSPDGSRIRFTRNRALWEMSSSGSKLHQLIPDWRTSVWKCCGRWTSDGEFFIFLSGNTMTPTADTWGGAAEMWAMDERQGRLRPPRADPVPLSSGPMRWGSPIPSRDGRKIFVSGLIQRGELVRWDGQSHQMRSYLGGISAEYVAFSKDGKSVAYMSFPDGILWKSNIDGSGLVQLTQPPVYPKLLRWSPDGTQILFNDLVPPGQLVMYVIPSQGGAPQRLLPEDNGPQMDPNWSPDGRKVVFSSAGLLAGRADFSSRVELRMLDLATHTVSVVPGSSKVWSPRWSPDGRFILGLSDKFDVRIFELKTQRWTKLAEGPVHWLALSRDSQFVYFLDSTRNVSRVSIKGGRVERVMDLTGFPHTGWMSDWMGLDPSDAPLLLHNVGSEDLYALTLDRK
jgi:Tol biopolymer transport system component